MSFRARLILAVLCAAQFMVALDFSILNIALPRLGASLGLDGSNLQWAATAFCLPSGGFLLLFGRIGDIVGRRRVLLAGLAVFAIASVLATVAGDAALFLAARALQGFAAGAIVPTGMALITTSFAEGPLRDRALGVSGMLLSLGFTIGVVLGGVLTQAFGWRSTMALSFAMATVIFFLAARVLRESRATTRPRLDVPGAVSVSLGLLLVIYGVSRAGQVGWLQPDVIVSSAAGIVALVLFGLIERRASHPLVAIAVLRRRTVAWGNLGGLVTFSMMSAVMFLCTLYLQEVDGIAPAVAGLVFGVMGVVAAVTGVVAPRFVARFGSRVTLAAGLVVQAAFVSVLLTTGLSGGAVVVAVAGSLACIGHLTAIVSYGITATSGLSQDEQGQATGLVTTAQQIGTTIGIPVISAIAAARASADLAHGMRASVATLEGIHLGIGVDVAVILVAAVLIGAFLLARPRVR